MPYEPGEKNLKDRVTSYKSLLARRKIERFIDRIITTDEKWITYEHIVRKNAYCHLEKPAPSTPEPNIVLLKSGEKLNSGKCC